MAGEVNIKENRKFGLLVGGAFVLIACYSFYRKGHINVVAMSIGSALVLAGLLIPSRLTLIKWGWEALGRVLGFINTYILLTVLYLIVVAPVGLVNRIIGKDILKLNPDKKAKTYWEDAEQREQTPLNQQF